MALLRIEDIDARMVFLRGYDSISHHTVAEVYEAGQYITYDPFYSLNFDVRDINNGSFSSHINDTSLYPPGQSIPKNYPDLFTGKYPSIIHSDNKLDAPRRFMRSMLWGYQTILGKLFTGPFRGMHN
jgi:hypothetical protein